MVETQTSPASPSHTGALVEDTDDVNFRGILIIAAILFVVIHLVCLVSLWMFGFFDARENAITRSQYPLVEEERQRLAEQPLAERLPNDPRFKDIDQRMPKFGEPLPWSMPKPPRLEGIDTPLNLWDPLNDGTKGWPSLAPLQREKEEKELSRPAWVDKNAETVRLPIDAIMKRLAGNLPVRSSAADPDRTKKYYQSPGGANSGRSAEEGK